MKLNKSPINHNREEIVNDYLHDLIFVLINLMVAKMRDKLTPYTIFAVIMLVNSLC
jgi:hypothetical protein